MTRPDIYPPRQPDGGPDAVFTVGDREIPAYAGRVVLPKQPPRREYESHSTHGRDDVPPRQRAEADPGNGFETQYAELLSEYKEALQAGVAEHDMLAGGVATAHSQRINRWLRTPPQDQSDEQFTTMLAASGQSVDLFTRDTAAQAGGIFKTAEHEFSCLLSEGDLSVLAQARQVARDHGFDRAKNVIGRASSRTARDAIRAALDAQVWEKAQAAVSQTSGLQGAKNVISWGSSAEVKQVMRAALDAQIWDKVKKLGADPRQPVDYAKNVISWGSSSEVRQAMKAALDAHIWGKAQTRVERSMEGAKNIVTHASSREAKLAMKVRLDGMAKRAREEPPSDNQNYGGQAGYRLYDTPPQQPRSRVSPEEAAAARAAAEAKAKALAEVRPVIEKVVSVDRGVRWLFDKPEEVLTVIEDVRKMRADAEARGKSLTDRQVYVRRRIEIDRPEIVEQPELHARLVEAMSILNAMMIGKTNKLDADGNPILSVNDPKGKLPF